MLSSKVFISLSVVLLAATGYMYLKYGQTVYYLAFHKPYHSFLDTSAKKSYSPAMLPKFNVATKVAESAPNYGDTQNVSLGITSNQNVSGYIEVWVKAPNNKQIYQSPQTNPTNFVKGKLLNASFNIPLSATLPSGEYKVSAIITSLNTQTDYYVNENFAEFSLP